MKNLLIAISVTTSALMSCDSHKGGFSSSRKAQSTVIAPKAKTHTVASNSVSRINEPISPAQPIDPNMLRLDSIVNAGGERLPYHRAAVMTPGVSGAGTGGSYASFYYAGGKKKKATVKTENAYVAPSTIQNNSNRIIAMADSASASQAQASTDTTTLHW